MPSKSVPNSGNATDFAEYAAALSGDMATLARRHGLQTLAYLLEMARLEAEEVANRRMTSEPN